MDVFCRGVEVEMVTNGLAVTLIDFTLSRLQTLTGEVAFCDLGADPDLFKGPKGDCQVTIGFALLFCDIPNLAAPVVP
jgi:hypothetical protein